MEALFLRVVWISLTCSVVLVPLLVGKGWLRQHVRAKALYVVWLILALRLVVPVDLSLPEPAVTVEAPSYQVALPARTPSANLPAGAQIEEPSAVVGQTAPEAASAVRTIPVTALLSALWLFGVLAAALVQGGGYLLARRRLLRDARPDLEAEAEAGQTAASLGLKRAVPVRRSGQVRTPMVLGLLRPVLLLPEGQEVDEVVLCHELTHLKRLDLAYKALLVAACWLHWFNPLVWWMSRAASENLELCCDNDVAAGRDAAFRRKYGELLLSTAEEKPGPTLSSRFGGSKQAMRDRLANLFVKKKRGRLLACTAVAVLILVGGLVACEGRPAMTDWEAVDALNESLSWDLDTQAVILSFTIPEGERDWSIRLDGEAGLGDADAIRTFNETDWVPGESYSFRLPIEVLLGGQLTLNVSLGDGAGGFSAGLASGALALISSQEVVEVLQNSFVYDGAEFSFTLPKVDWAWNIQISGRADTQELGGISLHYLDGTDWTPGETYSFELSSLAAQDVTQLTMHIFQGTQEWEIDLLPYLPYVNSEYGFTLTLPQSWRGQVEIREDDPNMQNVTCAASFYMRDAGDWDGAGFLVCINRCTSQEWAETEAAGNPYALPVLAETGGYVFYAAGPTDLPVDESIPGALERYEEFYAQVPDLLASFSLINAEAYAAAQSWLEEQVADGMPGIADYPCLEGRVESLYYEGAYGDYEVYSFVYSLRTDRPDLVEEDVLTDVDSQGWVSRPYYVATGGYPYLLMENGDIAAVYYSNSVPSIPGFWYTCSAIPQEERYQLAAIAAFAQTDALEQLYLGNPDWDQERTFTREELEAAGYQAETLPQNPWRRVVIDPWITQEEYLRNTFQSHFSASLTQRRLDAMFSGPDAPYLFYEEDLYFRDDVPCGPEIESYSVDWDSFSVTRTIDQPDLQGFEFTLSGTRTQGSGLENDTWTFLLQVDEPTVPQYFMSFQTWFDET